MADDVRVTIGGTSKGFQSEVNKVRSQLGGLKKSTADIGGVLEADRRVENKMTSWVQGIGNARNAADLLSTTLGDLGDVFKTSLAIGVGLNIGGAVVGMISNAIESVKKMKTELASLQAATELAITGMSSSGVLAGIDSLNEKIKEMKGSWLNWSAEITEAHNKIRDGYGALFDIGFQAVDLQKAILSGDVEQENAIKRRIALAEFEVKIAKLPLQVGNLLRSLEIDRLDIIEQIAEKKREEAEASKRAAEASKAQVEADRAAAEEAARNFQEQEEWEKKRLDAEKRGKEEMAALEKIINDAAKIRFDEELDRRIELRKKKEEEATKAIIAKEKELQDAKNEVAAAKAEDLAQARGAAGAMGVFKTGSSLPEQRASERFYARQSEINAGAVARDEFRRAVGGDTDRLARFKQAIDARKNEILGDRRTPQEKLNAAAAKVEQIAADVRALKNKVGVK